MFGGLEGLNDSQFLGWFFLPALQSLGMWMQHFKLAESITNAMQIPHAKCNLGRLQCLSLNQSMANTTDMIWMLAQMNSLEQLRLGMQYATSLEAWRSVGAIEPGLLHVAPTLRRLTLNPHFALIFHGAYEAPPQQKAMKLTHGILRTFPNLHTIRLPVSALIGWGMAQEDLAEALPLHIVDLVLRDCQIDQYLPFRRLDEIHRQLTWFLLYQVQNFKRLRRITVFITCPYGDPFQPDRNLIRQLGRDKGVLVNLMHPNGRPLDRS
ncbi:hypothetical protein N7462_000453 [Penicillium macrosclerotiorum]|uniref:uncharacterized protein n=1 Tax=Penicillium macrosclerotiorum TaxID=303699 RepID=UPI0025481A32|nr:uncharacterized protein N7462_000453 [Penicillium macrosclerotiorum]KAJ5698448.1 hypothetical protein N7462_000453 [Penicillium macrosclerotiorum]